MRASISAPWAAIVSAEDHLDERLLALEVVVERPEADVGLVRDLLDARVVDTLAGEQGFGGVDQLRSCRLASACVPIRGRGHDRHRIGRRGQLRERQGAGHGPVDLAVEDQADVAAGHLDAIGVRDHLALPVHHPVAL